MRKFEYTLHTNGSGLWSGIAKEVKVLKINLAYLNDEEDFGELRVYFDTESWNIEEDGLIYTDRKFITELRTKLNDEGYSSDVDYSEQGMQGDNYVSLDVWKKFIDSWCAPKTWEEKCDEESRTPGTQRWAELYSDNLGESND